MIKHYENAGIKHVNDSKAFIECSNTMHDVYENIDDYNLSRKRKVLIIFDDTIADIMTNKKISINKKRIIYYMQKIKYFTCIYHTILFSCPKRCKIKFNTLFYYEN